MLTEKDYCDYETCVALVELGMRITSRKVYSDRDTLKHSSRGVTYTVRTASAMGWVIAIPLYEAQKFLREEKHIDVLVYLDDLKGYFPFIRIWEGSWKTFISLGEMEGEKVTYSLNYEEALSEGIKEAVKILKEE